VTVPNEKKASVRERSSTDHDMPARASRKRGKLGATVQSGIAWETNPDAESGVVPESLETGVVELDGSGGASRRPSSVVGRPRRR
jgi:hypothetical protein